LAAQTAQNRPTRICQNPGIVSLLPVEIQSDLSCTDTSLALVEICCQNLAFLSILSDLPWFFWASPAFLRASNTRSKVNPWSIQCTCSRQHSAERFKALTNLSKFAIFACQDDLEKNSLADSLTTIRSSGQD
jgi:hypothetical protein